MINRDSDKGSVVDCISRAPGGPVLEIATIGDQPGDGLMFKRSGFSIAMGDGSDEVKSQAVETTDSCSDRAFAKAVEHFVCGSIDEAMFMDELIGRIEIHADLQALARHVAAWMTAAALVAEEPFRVSLSGGSTPRTLYRLLASDEFRTRFPWERVFWYWGDERFVPYDHPESNYRMACEAMLAKAPVPPENIHPMPTDGDPEEAAARYERHLQDAYGGTVLDQAKPLFDITLLGLGTDGHTASLLPDEPVLRERKRWVTAVRHGRPEIRITMTYPAIESSRRVAFLVAGKEKAAIFGAIRSGGSRVPAARIKPVGELIWFVDQAAAVAGSSGSEAAMPAREQ